MKYYLSLCAIAKDEDELLRDWIDYHLLLGVEHFYLYDNESKNPLAKLLEDHIRCGRVSLHHVQGKHQHLPAYQHCVDTYAKQTRWLGFLDIDEFVCLKKDYDLRLYLMLFEDDTALSVNWATFGSSGQLGYPTARAFVGERYQWRFPRDHAVNIHVKTFCDPRAVERFSTPHNAVFAHGRVGVNEWGLPVHGPYSPVSVKDIQVNHYLYRSQRHFMEKMARGRSNEQIRFTEQDILDTFVRQTKEACVFDAEINERYLRHLALARRTSRLGLCQDCKDAPSLFAELESCLAHDQPAAGLELAARLRMVVYGEAELARFWSLICRVLLAFDDPEAAKVIVSRLIRRNDNPDNLLLLAEVFQAQGRLQEAITSCLAAHTPQGRKQARALQAQMSGQSPS